MCYKVKEKGDTKWCNIFTGDGDWQIKKLVMEVLNWKREMGVAHDNLKI